ncbi:MAG: tyrosine-type recombinase/integrase [Gammaproteobacteria bacterium]|nr:tyrosine-type recombinase/integrase [Gammaproteobacteria bacterium]
MTQSTQPISPLRQRMIEDMQLRKLAPSTQTSYIRAVKKLADYLGHSPDSATAEDLRRFQLHLTDTGTSRITINATITALRFFFDVTVGDKEVAGKLNTVPVPRKLPVVLIREEVSRLLEATSSLKYKAAFSVAYGAGLRISEVASLKISDIDGERKTLHVEQGKGSKDRYAMLSPALLDILHRWWKEGRASGLLLDGGWLFPGQNPVNPLSTRQLSRAIRAAAADAEIDKRVSMHLLRHSFATHLLEQKVDIRLIQVLLGHHQLETTRLYTQVATDVLQEVTSPLETLSLPT